MYESFDPPQDTDTDLPASEQRHRGCLSALLRLLLTPMSLLGFAVIIGGGILLYAIDTGHLAVPVAWQPKSHQVVSYTAITDHAVTSPIRLQGVSLTIHWSCSQATAGKPVTLSYRWTNNTPVQQKTVYTGSCDGTIHQYTLPSGGLYQFIVEGHANWTLSVWTKS